MIEYFHNHHSLMCLDLKWNKSPFSLYLWCKWIYVGYGSSSLLRAVCFFRKQLESSVWFLFQHFIRSRDLQNMTMLSFQPWVHTFQQYFLFVKVSSALVDIFFLLAASLDAISSIIYIRVNNGQNSVNSYNHFLYFLTWLLYHLKIFQSISRYFSFPQVYFKLEQDKYRHLALYPAIMLQNVTPSCWWDFILDELA